MRCLNIASYFNSKRIFRAAFLLSCHIFDCNGANEACMTGFILTEKEGVEPSRRFSRPTPFPGEPLRPAWVFLHADTYRVSFYIILLLIPVFKKNFIKFDFKSSSFLIAEAERMGFEPMCPLGQTVFKTASLWPLRYLSGSVFLSGVLILISRANKWYIIRTI